MPTTSPDSISYPDTSYASGFVAALAAMATSIQTAFSKRGKYEYRWANQAAMDAEAGMRLDDTGFRTDTSIEMRFDGTSWKEWNSDWISWGTAPTNFTIGTGGSASSSQQYKYLNGLLRFKCKFVLGTSGASVGSTPFITTPMNLALLIPGFGYLNGIGNAYDLSATATFRLVPQFNGTNSNQVKTVYDPGNAVLANLSSTVPMTWAAGDIWTFEFWANPA